MKFAFIDPRVGCAVFVLLLLSVPSFAVDGCSKPDFRAPALFEATVSLNPFPTYATADFNGDGRPDLAVTDNGGNQVSILLNTGSGSFGPPRRYQVGSGPNGIAIGEFNGDAHLDIAVSSGTNDFSVMLGLGNGEFGSPTNFSVGAGHGRIVTGDFNNDSKTDLAVPRSDSSIGIYLGNGSGSFSQASGSPFTAGGQVSGFDVADFNSDTKLDLAVATSSGTFVLTGNGSGQFAGPVQVHNFQANAITTSDINNDNKPDLLIGSFQLVVLFGDGAGNFSSPTLFPHPSRASIRALTVVDMDGDSHKDAVAILDSPSGITIFKGNGAGSFNVMSDFLPAGSPSLLAIADFDNDGDRDIVGSSSLMLNAGGGRFDALRVFYTPVPTPPVVTGVSLDVATADFNVDGRSDLAVLTRPNGSAGYGVTVLLRDNEGNFSNAAFVNFGFAFNTVTASLEVADFNNDTFPDIAAAGFTINGTNVLRTTLGNGNGTFGPLVTRDLPGSPAMASGDLDNDGMKDLVLVMGNQIRVFKGNGNQNILSISGPAPSVGNGGVAIANLDGDNKPDLIIADNANKAILTMLGDGNGLFHTQRSLSVTNSPTSLTAADFNADTKSDVAVTLQQPSGSDADGLVGVFFGDGTGALTASETFVASGQPSGIVTADFDGDTRLDLAVARSGQVSVLSGNGSGSFFAAVHFRGNGIVAPLVTGDFDNDGRPDIASPSSFGGVGILYGKAPVSQPCLFVDDLETQESDPAGGQLTIRLSEASSQIVSVNYLFKIVGNGAIEGIDFTGGSGTIVFQPGETTKVLSAGVINDTLDEDPEVFNLSLFGAQNARISDGVSKITIFDEDSGPAVSISDVTITEGNSGQTNANLTLSLSQISSHTVFVSYQLANGTATAGEDYLPTQGGAMINVGQLSAVISVSIVGDLKHEPDETFLVNITNVVDATVQDSQGQVTILDNDPIPSISIQDANVGEPTSAVSVRITLSNPSSVPISVNYATADNTATAGNDYSTASGSVTFNSGETEKTITLSILDDALDEISESFFINLSNPVNGTLGDDQGSVAIADNDGPTISINDVTVTEGNGGPVQSRATFTISLSAPSVEFISVRFGTANGTAIGSVDYQSVANRTLNIVPGSTSVTTSVNITRDMIIEPEESFTANLSSPFGATIADGQGVATIIDDDVTSVRFTSSTASVSETDGSITVNVERIGDLQQPFTAHFGTQDFSVGVSAKSDYTAAFGILQFAPGETSKSITIFITNDAHIEGPEDFLIFLSGPNFETTTTPSSLVVTINSDDVGVAPNPIDASDFFVRQHYRDFLNRDPDPSGLAFWINEIESCGANQQCRDVKRINVSAAFFLSIEFQETGYFAYRAFKAAFGDTTSPGVQGTVPLISLSSFLNDSGRIGRGVQVGIGNWQQQLEDNKVGYLQEFVQGLPQSFPGTLTAEQFVDKLDQNAGGVLSPTERAELIAILGPTPADVTRRAQVLRRVVEDTDFNQNEFNRAFVLMQYFGYLRRNPNDPQDNDFAGWKFWLDKLNHFNGNFADAEMVKAFLLAGEYRVRFGN